MELMIKRHSRLQKSPYVHLWREHVQNTSNSTFHLLKNNKSHTALVRFDHTMVMYSFSTLQPTNSMKTKSFIVRRPLVIVVVILLRVNSCLSCAVCAALIPPLTVEGTGVITPALGRVIPAGEAVTLAGLKYQRALVPKSVSVWRLSLTTRIGELKPWSQLCNNTPLV